MTKRKASLVAAVIAFAGAIVPTLIALQMIADNNAQGEVHDTVTGQWDIGYVLAFSGLFFAPSFLIIFAIAYGLSRRWKDPADDDL